MKQHKQKGSNVMKNAAQKKEDTFLPRDANQALRELIRLSRRLVDFSDQEGQALIKNDHLQFALVQQDKERLAEQYMRASEEFRGRIEDFRTADKGLLMQLDRLQAELKEKAANNNETIDRVATRARANTQSTLFSAQEMGQRVQFADQVQQSQTQGA